MLFSRLIQLIKLLQEARGYTVAELSRLLQVNRRTVYRDLERLENEGFPVEQKLDNTRYFLARALPAEALLPEEAALVQQALGLLPRQDPLVLALRQKLNLQQDLQPMEHQLRLIALGECVQLLHEAIEQKEQVVLEGYQSASSNSCSDRLVEPIALQDHHSLLLAYEPQTTKTKYFRLDRISRVGYTGKPQCHRRKHQLQLTDAFGMSGAEEKEVRLLLTTRAAMLLRAECPLTEPDIKELRQQNGFPFCYCGKVRSWQGIGRFVLGLPGEIKVEGPDGLQEYLKSEARNFWLYFPVKLV